MNASYFLIQLSSEKDKEARLPAHRPELCGNLGDDGMR